MTAGRLAWGLAFALGVAPAVARADVRVTALPLLGSEGISSDGWTPLAVRIENSDGTPLIGRVRATGEGYSFHASGRRSTATEAAVNVPAGTTVTVRLPMRTFGGLQIGVQVLDERGIERGNVKVPPSVRHEPLLVDLNQPGRMARLRGARLPVGYDVASGSRGSSAMQVGVGSVPIDATTGDLLAPTRSVEWSLATMVLAPSDGLARLGAEEQEALADYVLSGGTLAVAIKRPEDLRQGFLPRLLGGTAEALGTATVLGRLALEAPLFDGPGDSEDWKGAPDSKARPEAHGMVKPGRELADTLQLYGGGNLRPTEFGASAPYGLGEVHLLAFDPGRPTDADDAWVQAQTISLMRHAWDRRAFLALPPGGPSNDATSTMRALRQQLDPNAQSYWAIALAALLLCAYAVVAGPVNFFLSARRGKPLQALVILVALSGLTFGLVVAVAVTSKGVRGRSDRLSLTEAAGGMNRATIRRYRSFFTPTAQRATIGASSPKGLLWTVDEAADQANLVMGRAGVELRNVDVLPWQPRMAREDDIVSLGEGVSLVPESAGDEVRVVNRTGRGLRGVVVHVPRHGLYLLPSIADGASVLATSGQSLLAESGLTLSTVGSHGTTMTLHTGDLSTLEPELEKVTPGLGGAWRTIETLASVPFDWWPSDQPALIAQIDGGEGLTNDQGMNLVRDRRLVRVVGAGGQP